MMYKYEPQALQQLGMQQSSFNPLMGASTQQLVYGPDGKVYNNPAQARAAGVENPTNQPPFETGIGEYERRQFQPRQPQTFDSSAGIGDFEARQFQPYNQQEPQQPQALQQMGMRQQSYQPLPQAPSMQPFLQQFRTQQRPYQLPFQQQSGQMFPNSQEGYRSGSAYNYNNSLFGQMNNLAPLNKNALNFSY